MARVEVYAVLGSERRALVKAVEKVCKSAGLGDVQVLPEKLLLKDLKEGVEVGADASLVILCHYNEGRVLLTDRDGMYNDFLVVAHRNCGGNILLVISGVETEGDSLANTAFVDSLVWEGAQNAMGELNTQGRLLTWKGTPSSAHKEQILKALQGQLSPLELPESVIEYANVTNGDKGGGFICNIL